MNQTDQSESPFTSDRFRISPRTLEYEVSEGLPEEA